ncbi:MAG: hypothetical protein CSA29_06295 [Desulfobacterales bacterium]|nr:MAG: hypothetical protein CSA29_06295 [Desulfobacterales bacterium]
MKARTVIFITSMLMLLWTALAFAAPKAVIPNPRYEFSPSTEGLKISHDFIIKNEGDTELKILSVLPP